MMTIHRGAAWYLRITGHGVAACLAFVTLTSVAQTRGNAVKQWHAPASAVTPAMIVEAGTNSDATRSAVMAQNARILHLATSGDQPVLLPLVKGFPCVVEFPKGEKVLDIAVGGLSDWSTSWEVVKRDTAFFIKPLANAQMTTMIVGTSEHHYVFDLQALAATPENHGKRLSRLILAPPQMAVPLEELVQTQQKSQQQQDLRKAQEQATLIESQIKALKEARYAKRARNYDYTMEVVSLIDDIRPREAFDDGRFTYLKFPDALQIPAVYRGGKTAADETLMNSHIEDDYLVLHGVHTHWVLRLGGSVIGVHNEAFNPQGVSTQSGTSTIAQRVLK